MPSRNGGKHLGISSCTVQGRFGGGHMGGTLIQTKFCFASFTTEIPLVDNLENSMEPKKP